MRKMFLIPMIFMLACNQQTGSKSNNFTNSNPQELTDNEKPKYNPRVDSVYYFPADSNNITFSTIFQNYKIETNIFPILGKYVVSYSEYFDNTSKERRDKIYYRDYKLNIKITDNVGFITSRLIDKYEFSDILKPNPDNYFIREVKFIGFEKNEFRFDIKICFLDSDEPGAMIKYFIGKDSKFRYEDYPESYYDSLYPSPD